VSRSKTDSDAFTSAMEQINTCALDEQGIQEQRRRHARLAPSVTNIERGDEAVEIRFAPGFDRQTLGEMVAVEEECCPFFQFDFDERKRQLTVTVLEAEQAPALDAIAAQLTGGGQVG
jgi:hypothetical protein